MPKMAAAVGFDKINLLLVAEACPLLLILDLNYY
jgi:hypothetical protein